LSNDETIRVVIEEDEATTEEGGEKPSARCASNFSQLDSEALDTTRPFHDGDEAGEKESKEVDVSVTNVRQGLEDVFLQS
jgi:hypothetical protein